MYFFIYEFFLSQNNFHKLLLETPACEGEKMLRISGYPAHSQVNPLSEELNRTLHQEDEANILTQKNVREINFAPYKYIQR